MKDAQKVIQGAFDNPQALKSPKTRQAVEFVIRSLDQGKLRVCRPSEGQWITEDWVKKAILLYFRSQKSSRVSAGALSFFDKVPIKKWTGKEGVRVVPPAVVRRGAFVASGAVLMPSYVNIGAYVGSGTMVDTWATVGSCAQVGERVHISGGVGIGGVLEPPQARPVIVEDDVFLGSRCIIVEGVRIGRRAVIGAGVVLTASTKIIDVTGKSEKESTGEIPENSVVIPGTRMKNFAAGTFGVPCALIIGQRNARTDEKTSLNQALRDFDVPV